MGIVSILLGIISFIGFTGAGVILGNSLVDIKNSAAETLQTLKGISNTNILIGVIAVFAIIGLLIMVSLVMQGLTYNKVVKIQKRVHRL